MWLADPRGEPHAEEMYRRLGFGRSGTVGYGAIFQLPGGEWLPAERVSLSGAGWRAVLSRKDTEFPEIAYVDGEFRTLERTIAGPTVLVAVAAGGPPTAQRASMGRERLQTLTGALSVLLHPVLFAMKAWDGFLEQAKDGRIRFEAVGTYPVIREPDIVDIPTASVRAASLDPASLPETLARALRWHARGTADRDRIDAFISYWLATLLIIQSWHHEIIGPPVSGGEHPVRKQVRDYLRQRMGLDGSEEESLFARIDSMYDTRHSVFKGSRLDVDVGDVLRAETTCRHLLSFELGLLPERLGESE